MDQHYSTEALERRLAELTEPLVTELRTIESAIGFHASELETLRATRQRVTGVLAKLDPDLYGPKPKPKKTEGKQTVTPEEIKNVRTWLEENPPNGDGIWAAKLSENREFREYTRIRSGVIMQALAELHEQSFLTLDRMGRGGSRIYKVVA
jgi:hypothetical protein